MQILLFAPSMAPLLHIHVYVDKTAAQVWANRGSVITASSVGPIPQELYLVDRRQHIHASVGRVPGEDNNMEDSASQLTHLPDRKFISDLYTHFPQSKPWRLIPLPSGCKQQITTVLHNKQSPRGSLQPSSRKTPPPGANGSASAAGCKFPLTSNTLRAPFPSSKFSPSTSVPAFCPCKGNLSIIDLSKNTSARLVKSLHLWGPTTSNTTAWGSSTFVWDARWRPIRGRILLQQECSHSMSALSKPRATPPR